MSIEESIAIITPKMDANGRDWTKNEKLEIEKCYFEITKVSTGTGRSVDLGCSECVESAVNIIRNYRKLVERSEAEEGITPTKEEAVDWTATLKTIATKAKEVNFEIPKEAKTKASQIEALQAFLESTEEEDEDDILGEKYSREQLAAIIKAKTGEEVDLDDPEVTDAALLEYVETLNQDEDGQV